MPEVPLVPLSTPVPLESLGVPKTSLSFAPPQATTTHPTNAVHAINKEAAFKVASRGKSN